MSPPVATAPAVITTSNPTAFAMGGGSFSSFNDLDLDQFILKDTNNNELMPHMLNVHDTDNGLNGFKGFLSTSPDSCSSILNNHLLNPNEFDLFKFDKLTSNFSGNDIFDFNQQYSNTSSMPHNNNTNGTFNISQNSNNIHSHDSEETESDEDHIVQNLLLQDQELDPEAFELALSDDNDHMINDFGMISVAGSQADIISHHNSHLNNDDALVAIRDMKRQHPRKHKNSTSSISSVSTSIKKVAIELQNSCTANLVSGLESAVPGANHHNQTNNMLVTGNANNLTSGSLGDFDDDNDFDDILGLDDWEQMLDEDYISRFTTDFSNNYTASAGPNTNCTTNGMNQSKASVTPLASHIQTVKLPVSHNSNKELSQGSRLVPHISTMSTSKSSNQPLVLVLSNSSSSSPLSSSSAATSSSTSSSSIYQNKLKTNSSPSLTPIASPMCNQIKKLSSSTITPTKIISTSKSTTTPTTTNVVKKLNSVIINDNGARTESNSPFSKNTTIKLENGNSNIQNNHRSNTSVNGYSNVILKNKTNTATNHITSTTSKTITRQIPLTTNNALNQQPGIRSYRVNQPFNSTNISLSGGGSSVNCSSASSASSSPNLSPNASTSPSSSIDYPEIIDCVNPNQIFPYRLPLLRFVKTDVAAENGRGEADSEWRGNKYYSTSQAYEDDEEEEEIDVVSVHNNNTGGNSSNHLNMNYHSYFQASSGPAVTVNSTMSSTTSKKQGSKKNSKNSEGTSSSLLASYLKSPSKSNTYPKPNNYTSMTNVIAPTSGSVTKVLCKNEASTTTTATATSVRNNNKQQYNNHNNNNLLCASTNSNSSFIKTTKLNSHGLANNNGSPSSSTAAGNKFSENSASSSLDLNKSLTKSSSAGRKANSGLKKSSLNRQLPSSNSVASSLNNNSMGQLNSIRILTTTPSNGNSSTNNGGNLRQINTTSISKTPQASSIKLNNSTSSPMILNKDSSASPITTTTKYITMTSSKLHTNNNIKCQTITPTINSNKPKIVSATNNSVLNLSASSLNNGSGSLNSNLKFNTFTTSNQNGGTTSSYITTLKIPTSLSKMSNKPTNKVQVKEDTNSFSGSSLMKASLNGNNSNSAMLTEDDEFYYEDEEFGRSLGCSMLEKSSTAFIKNEVNLNTNLNSTSNIQLSSVKFNDEEALYSDCVNGDLSDDMDDIDDDDIDDEDDDECSTSSSTASPSPPTSSSSGFSTPTKGSKLKAELCDINDISTFGEKLSKKPKKSMSSSSSSSLSSNNLNSTTSKRNSRLTSMGYSSDNPAEKRAFHILSERQRRNDLKKLFETLRTNIPTLCDKQKASKLTILKAAVDHLCEVSNKKEKLSSVYEKEKIRHAQLVQHLKSLQNQQQNQKQHMNFIQTVQTSNQSALAVH